VRPSWWLFFLICIPIFIGSVDLTAVIVVLPQAALDLLGPEGIGRADVALWVVTAYLLAYTISLVFAGRLSDIWGRKNVFLAVTAIFILGSLWSGAATDFPLQVLRLIPVLNTNSDLPLISLIIGRVVQAIGAGASVSVGMALVGDLYPPEQRTRLVSLIGGIDSLGWVAGNILALAFLPQCVCGNSGAHFCLVRSAARAYDRKRW
jgi:MFS family permease